MGDLFCKRFPKLFLRTPGGPQSEPEMLEMAKKLSELSTTLGTQKWPKDSPNALRPPSGAFLSTLPLAIGAQIWS